jgi:hypothetical protein
VITDSGILNGSSIWITTGAEYDSGNEIWIGQREFNFFYDTAVNIKNYENLKSLE